jgi:hypothetical protein
MRILSHIHVMRRMPHEYGMRPAFIYSSPTVSKPEAAPVEDQSLTGMEDLNAVAAQANGEDGALGRTHFDTVPLGVNDRPEE